MEITYKNNKIRKICTDSAAAKQVYGKEMAFKIHMRIAEITQADTVEAMIRFGIGRCHPLSQNRKDQYAVDLIQPYRLVFEKKGSTIQVVKILEIVDYH